MIDQDRIPNQSILIVYFQMEQTMKVADRIHCDAEFGRQMMCANNSIYLTKVAILNERWMGAVDHIPEHVFNGKKITVKYEI